ncbi:MAG: aromatic ring-hydroxylating dioxygenase subunit alpha, partial [Caldimonas sp.]
MSDLRVTPEVLAPAASTLPVFSYFDPKVYGRERELLFARSPRYIGHELAVPDIGDYYALPQESEGRALVRTPNGPQLVSNV